MERRKRKSSQAWRRIIGEQEKSGLAARKYCSRKNICVSSFYQWRRRLSEKDESFIDMGRLNTPDVSASADESPWVVRLDFGDGFKLTIQRG